MSEPSEVAPTADPGFLEPRHQDLMDRVDRFAAEQLGEVGDESPGRALERLAAEGLLDFIVPAAHGGALESLELRSICCIRERLARASGLADLMFVMQGLGSNAVLLGGSEAVCDAVLPGLRTGEQIAAIAMTEPGAGSDLGSIAVTARRDGDEYVLDGVKQYIRTTPCLPVRVRLSATRQSCRPIGDSSPASCKNNARDLDNRQEEGTNNVFEPIAVRPPDDD